MLGIGRRAATHDAAKSREPGPKARFDRLGVNHGQGVLGWQAPMRPIGGIIGRLQDMMI
jgi:hypothetical protein